MSTYGLASICLKILITLPTTGTGAFKENKYLNFDDISSSKTEYSDDPLILVAFLFFSSKQLFSEQMSSSDYVCKTFSFYYLLDNFERECDELNGVKKY